mmetsp:Transcript_16984/g.35901  ORF Transcript_16984/g.35901 Transcript_16984/m.35901 type:complete len:216 (-) Transcript_16984:921-1568(-)
MTGPSSNTEGGSTRTTIINVYCILSALFFAACAFSQLNDPDPFLWILDYIFGGCLFNILVMMYHPGAEESDADVRVMCRVLLSIFASVNGMAIFYITMGLLPQIDTGLSTKELAWSVLEFEEGREIVGLLILLMHVIKLGGYLAEVTTTSDTKKENSKQTGGQSCVGTVIMAGALAGAIYLWVYYQPEMNAKYKTEHCDGAFGTERAGDAATGEL